MNKIPNYNSPVTTNISKIADKKGLKQRAIAENAGLTPQALCDAISGRRILKISEVNNVAKALGVEVNELFKSDD